MDYEEYKKDQRMKDSESGVMDMDIEMMEREVILSLKPLSDRLLIRLYEPEWVTDGGIIIPEQGRSQPLVGRVLKVGKGLWDHDKKEFNKPDIYKGQYVLVSNVTYTKEDLYVDEDDIKYVMLRQHKINGIFASKQDALFGWYQEPDVEPEELA